MAPSLGICAGTGAKFRFKLSNATLKMGIVGWWVADEL